MTGGCFHGFRFQREPSSGLLPQQRDQRRRVASVSRRRIQHLPIFFPYSHHWFRSSLRSPLVYPSSRGYFSFLFFFEEKTILIHFHLKLFFNLLGGSMWSCNFGICSLSLLQWFGLFRQCRVCHKVRGSYSQAS